MEKWGKVKEIFSTIFVLFKGNTNDAHMQDFIQFPQQMKTGFLYVFKLVKLTLPFDQNPGITSKFFIFFS